MRLSGGITSIGRPATCILATLALAPTAHAGMTVYGLRDIHRMRFEEISFFLALLVGCAFVLKLLWNHAGKGYPAVPRLKFLQAFCLALLLGCSMLLILAMISGIREVLTPEAWRHQGTSYRLNSPAQEPARRRGLEQLREVLFDYARTHGGKFPAHDYVPEIAGKLWESPDQLGSHYVYSGGLTTNDLDASLAIEPPGFGDRRFVLKVSGQIEATTKSEVDQKMRGKPRP